MSPDLSRLFDPESITIVGASEDERKIGHQAMANAKSFDGPVYPINPNAGGEILGHRCYDSVEDVEDVVDLCLLCIPGPVVPDVIDECGRAGVGGVVVYAAGFSEASEAGGELEAEIVARAREHDVAVLGPNTSGFVNVSKGVYASFVSDVEMVPDGAVSVVAQSGGISHVLLFMAADDGGGLAKAIGLGNRADVGFPEVIAHLDADSNTDAIVLHVEGTDDAREMLEACRAAETPVVMYKVGQSNVSDFAASHTGALMGEYDLYEAACAQYEVPMATSCQKLLDSGYALASLPRPDGTNVALVTGQAGPGIAIADRLKADGVTLPEFTAETQAVVEEILPGITYASNPVDTGQPPDQDAYERLLETIATDDAVDALLVYQLYEKRADYPVALLERLVHEEGVPVAFATNGPTPPVEAGLERFRDAGVPAYRSPERAASAMSALIEAAKPTAEAGSEWANAAHGTDERTEDRNP